MATKLFVGGISWNTRDETLKAHFEKVGMVVSATVIFDRVTKKSKGFGFVEMSTEEEAKRAVTELNNSELDGRNILVSEARPQEPRSDNRGGDRGGDRGGFRRN